MRRLSTLTTPLLAAALLLGACAGEEPGAASGNNGANNATGAADVGGACEGPADCLEGLRCYEEGGGDRYCVQTCTPNANRCPAGQACVPVQEGVGFCDFRGDANNADNNTPNNNVNNVNNVNNANNNPNNANNNPNNNPNNANNNPNNANNGCAADGECGDGEICDGGTCRAGCRDDGGCGDGEICQGNTCRSGCREDLDCNDGQICEASACRTGCRSDAGCNDGEICQGNACRAGCRDDSGCDDGETCQGSVCVEARCEGVVCSDGEVCNPETGSCEPFVCAPDLHEPNEDTPTPIAASTTIPGLTICAGDLDVFEIPLAAGQDARVHLTFSHAAGDLDLEIYDAAGDLIGLSESETDDEEAFAPTRADDALVYAVVYGFPEDSAENIYTLRIEIDPAGDACYVDEDCLRGTSCTNNQCDLPETCDDPAELNDDSSTATPLTPGVPLSTPVACGLSDEDWYTFTLAAESDVYVTLEFLHTAGDVDAALFDGEGEALVLSGSANDNEYLPGLALPAGVYYVAAFAYEDALVPYTVTLALNPAFAICLEDADCDAAEVCTPRGRCAAADTCEVDQDCADPDAPFCDAGACACLDALEPNDTEQAAHALSDLTPDTLLNTCGTDDWYTFNATAGQTIDVTVLFFHDDGDIDVELFDPAGQRAGLSESGDDDEAITVTAASSGVWSLVVYTYPAPDAVSYRLRVSVE